jgi:arylsulfatase A-like enzyme
MASTVDLLPTFAALSGQPYAAPDDRPIDGHDLSDLFRGELPETSPRNTFVYYTDNTEPGAPRHPRRLSAVRQGKWKYYLAPQRFRLAGEEENTDVPAGALFDLEKDAGETRNMAPENPRVVRRLQAFAEKAAEELGDIGQPGNGVRKAGYFEDALPMNAGARPDILFIALDDMNDWTTLFDPGNPIQTPNLQRLASRGCLFTRAYCAAPACSPSRAAVFSGLNPATSGLYNNPDRIEEHLQGAVMIPQYFRSHGYRTWGVGKLFHGSPLHAGDPERPFFQRFQDLRRVFPPVKMNGILTGRGQSPIFDWGEIDGKLTDHHTADMAEACMSEARDRPLFQAVGIWAPHLPHFAGPEFFSRYPLESLVQPPMPENDLDDVPQAGREMAHFQYYWSGYLFNDPPPRGSPASLEKLTQSYQAAASFSDSMVGRLLDKLDSTGRADSTIIVLWSDHGYHLGDKESVVKFTLWEKACHVPFIIVAPGVTTPGSLCNAPVSLVDIYPTLVELAGLPPKEEIDGQSLVPLLKDPGREWERPALTTWLAGNHAVRSRDWRYICYADGTEELYDMRLDHWNHANLAGQPGYEEVIELHRKWLPGNE